MKDLQVNKHTTLKPPDDRGDVEIEIWLTQGGYSSEFVPFKQLKMWVASIESRKNKKLQTDACAIGTPDVCNLSKIHCQLNGGACLCTAEL